MRPIRLCLVLAASCISFEYAGAQASDKTQRTIGIKTQQIKVDAVCELCKKKIEKTASSVPGIKSAVWNENTKMLTVKYDVFKKEAIDNVQRKIADEGYDTEKFRAADAAMKKDSCCCHNNTKS
ncbi:MAG: heavy metal-associated domain-containing protein [Chitinophagaceae bacterium]